MPTTSDEMAFHWVPLGLALLLASRRLLRYLDRQQSASDSPSVGNETYDQFVARMETSGDFRWAIRALCFFVFLPAWFELRVELAEKLGRDATAIGQWVSSPPPAERMVRYLSRDIRLARCRQAVFRLRRELARYLLVTLFLAVRLCTYVETRLSEVQDYIHT